MKERFSPERNETREGATARRKLKEGANAILKHHGVPLSFLKDLTLTTSKKEEALALLREAGVSDAL